MTGAIDFSVVNRDLNKQAQAIRVDIPMRRDPGDLSQFIRAWSEEDVIDGRPCKAFVVILKTRGCTWALAGGCTMCGYANESAWAKVSDAQLVEQFRRAWSQYAGEELVKIYTSGSFLDRFEVPPAAQAEILRMIGKRSPGGPVDGPGSAPTDAGDGTGSQPARKAPLKVAVEARPDYIHDHSFDHLHGLVEKLEVGIGVESHNLRVLRDSVNKGHPFEAFPEAARICHAHGVSVKSYIMLKPPFLKESDALVDTPDTIAAAAPHAEVVSVNPTNVQGNTVVDALYKRGSFRPPWLWTIVTALLEGHRRATAGGGTAVNDSGGLRPILKSDVIAAGQSRGAHNCGKCDEDVVAHLKKFKATQDPVWLERCLADVQCRCRTEWRLTVELGPLVPAYAHL